MLSYNDLIFIPLYVLKSSLQQLIIRKSLYTKDKNPITNKLNNTTPKYTHLIQFSSYILRVKKLYINKKGSNVDSNNARDIGE